MGIKNADLKDLIATTLPDLPGQEFEVQWDNQDYEFTRIYQNERMEIDGGTQIERKVMFDNTGNARYRYMYDTDEPAVRDVMKTIVVPWVQLGTHYSWDKLEILRQRNNEKGFIRLMDVRRIDGLWSLADLIEDRSWKTPQSATDVLYPYGVPYYINQLTLTQVNAGTTSGFAGQTIVYQDGSTGTVCAGIDSSAEAKWRNYAAIYDTIDNALLKTYRLAFMKTRFKAPIIVNDPSNKRTAQKRTYTNFENVADLMELADMKQDNHSGNDVLGNLRVDDGGMVYINRLPVIPIPQLEGATNNPIYTIDFAKFKPVVQADYWMDESEPMVDRGQHTTFTIYLDSCHNNLCDNKRTVGFVLHNTPTS
jgi:hypothetical protein